MLQTLGSIENKFDAKKATNLAYMKQPGMAVYQRKTSHDWKKYETKRIKKQRDI